MGDGELKICIYIFGSIYSHHDGLAVVAQDASAIVVENNVGVNEVGMLLEQPIDTGRSTSCSVAYGS